jgi:hypothetical protein
MTIIDAATISRLNHANTVRKLAAKLSSPPSRKGGPMRRARIVRIEWDGVEGFDIPNCAVSVALANHYYGTGAPLEGIEFTVTGEPSFAVEEK